MGAVMLKLIAAVLVVLSVRYWGDGQVEVLGQNVCKELAVMAPVPPPPPPPEPGVYVTPMVPPVAPAGAVGMRRIVAVCVPLERPAVFCNWTTKFCDAEVTVPDDGLRLTQPAGSPPETTIEEVYVISAPVL